MRKIVLFFILCISTITAHAQFPLTISGDPLVYTGWIAGGSGSGIAPVVDNPDSAYTLTSSVENEANYIYYDSAINMSGYCQVTAEFDFQITATTGTPVADGMAFWFLSNPPTATATGEAIGLPNFANGLIMILDTYDNNSTPDNPIETLLGYDGSTFQYVEDATTGVLGTNLYNQNYVTDGSWHHCKMTYVAGNVNVYFNNSATPSLTGYYPLAFAGYFGFSGSTGLYYSRQRIKNVSIFAAGIGTVPVVTSPVTYCVNAHADSLHAVAVGGSPLHWYTSDTATVVSLSGSPTPNTTVPGTYTYYVRQGSGTCLSEPDSVKIIVSPVPAAPPLAGDTFYCQNAAYVAFTSTDTGVHWYTADTGGVGSAVVPVVPTDTPGSYTYYAAQIVNGCSGIRDSIHVTVEPTPATPSLLTGLSAYCQYAPFVAFTVTGSNLTWHTGSPSGTGSAAAPVVNTAIAGSYDFYVTQTTATCPSLPLHLPVTVNPQPAIPVVASPVYCQFVTSVPITATGSNLTWHGPGITAGYTTAPSPSTATPVIENYYVTQTISGCTSDSAIAVVTVKPKPGTPVTRDTSYCQNSTAAALTAIGSDISWYTTATVDTALAASPVPSTTVPGNTTYYASQTVGGCESDRAPLVVTIVDVPSFTITASAPAVCQFDSLILSYNGEAGGYIYNWALPSGASFATGSAATMSVVGVVFNAPNHNIISLTAGGPDGRCSATQTIDINVAPQPAGDPYTRDLACLGDTLSLALINQSSNAVNFGWTVDNDSLNASPAVNVISANINSGGPFVISWLTTGIHVITLYAETVEGCKAKPSLDTVNVKKYPNADFTYLVPNGSLCLEDSVLFDANDSDNSDLFQWSPDHYFNNNNGHTIWGRMGEAKSLVTLTVTDAYGCSASTTRELNASYCCTVTFPQAFTPNNDQHNDVFRPISAGYHHFHNLRIVNRWGQLVFESTNSAMEWDGTYNGVPQDIGVYYYILTYDCGGESMTQKGDVTLLR